MKNIPKICHLYWGGSSPMPELMTFTASSFHKCNPDWEIIVYKTLQRDDELGQNTFNPYYKGKDYFYLVESMPFVTIKTIDVADFGIRKDIHSSVGSDFFRTYVLYNFGGLCSDFDIVWLKPMEALLDVDCIGDPNDFDMTVCLYEFTHGHHSIGAVLARQNSDFVGKWISRQKDIWGINDYQTFGNTLLNSDFPNLWFIRNQFPNILGLRYETFYPYSTFNLNRLYTENDITPINNKNVLGLHWFNGASHAQDYINNGGFSRDCSMTSILKQEGYI